MKPHSKVHLEFACGDGMLQHLASVCPLLRRDSDGVHPLQVAEHRAGRADSQHLRTFLLQEFLHCSACLILQEVEVPAGSRVNMMTVEAPAPPETPLLSQTGHPHWGVELADVILRGRSLQHKTYR